MSFLDTMRRQKLLSLSLLVFTLSIGIVIGTLLNTGVNAAKGQTAAADATPLEVPPVAKMPNNQFVELAKRLEASVVNISTDYTPKPRTSTRRGEEEGEGEEEEGKDLFRRFFGNRPPGEGGGPTPKAFKRHATGSGFIVDRNGYLLTNYHVVERADAIKVKMSHNANEFRAKMIGFDEETDLAVLKIDAPEPFAPAKIGNSDAVQVGDWAVAIGSPFGLEATVTAGIVSATGRDIEGARQFQRFIQTAASINQGNSGGPLLNINGEVIGINTAIATQSGGYQGVGFALPVNTAAQVYNSIIKSGKMSRGSIGIGFQDLKRNADVMRGLGLKEGVIVERVNAEGPAAKAGIKVEDVIVGFNGKPVKDGDDLVSRVSSTPIGSDAKISIDRNGKRMEFTLKIGDREEQSASLNRVERPPVEQEQAPGAPTSAAQAKFGISIRPVTEAERKSAGVESKAGVVVTSVQEGSFAEEVGLQEKDIIMSINRQAVSTTEEVRGLQGKLKSGDAVAFRVLRPNAVIGRAAESGRYTGTYLAGTLPLQ